jgi:hypothetical protein
MKVLSPFIVFSKYLLFWVVGTYIYLGMPNYVLLYFCCLCLFLIADITDKHISQALCNK